MIFFVQTWWIVDGFEKANSIKDALQWHLLFYFSLHRYVFLFFINPQFYGYAAIVKVLLNDVQLKCAYDSTLNCINTNGNAVLASFGYDTVNIYENLAVS